MAVMWKKSGYGKNKCKVNDAFFGIIRKGKEKFYVDVSSLCLVMHIFVHMYIQQGKNWKYIQIKFAGKKIREHMYEWVNNFAEMV